MFAGLNMYWARIRLMLAPTARRAEKTNLQKKKKKMEIKSPYLTSVAKNSHLTNKLETDVALIYPIPPPLPSLHLCSI